MKYTRVKKINAARHIARSAQQKIQDKTGIRMTVMLYPRGKASDAYEQMLRVIALSLGMSPECFMMRTRKREIAELRFIAAMFLRTYFPNITLNEIAALFGGQDHSSVMSGLARAHCLLYTCDPRFLKKYNTTLASVNLWLTKEGSGYASAYSA